MRQFNTDQAVGLSRVCQSIEGGLRDFVEIAEMLYEHDFDEQFVRQARTEGPSFLMVLAAQAQAQHEAT